MNNRALDELDQQFIPGESVLYGWFEATREILIAAQPHSSVASFVNSRAHNVQHQEELQLQDEGGEDDLECDESLHPLSLDTASVPHGGGSAIDVSSSQQHAANVVRGVISGEPLTERKSTFQAHLAPVKTVADVKTVMDELLSNSKIQRATHNMMAYRIWSEERQLFHSDCDDDGESAAGGRLLRMLEIMGVRDVVVVVSRWFGGTLLGPQRFTHINNTARLLLEQCGHDNRDRSTRTGPVPKKLAAGKH